MSFSLNSIKAHAGRLLARGSVAPRALRWLKLLRRVRATTIPQELGLVLSFVIDTLMFAFRSDRSRSFRSAFPCLVYERDLDAQFYVRGRTDDLHNVMPFREGDVHEAILSRLNIGDVFVDGGANVGYYSVLGAKRVGPRGKVVAIEPIPATANVLRRNIGANGLSSNVVVLQIAVGATDGQTSTISVVEGVWGQASIQHRESSSGLRTYSVPATTIDQICKDFSRVNMIKLDIEGAELGALQGAQETLRKTDYLVIECNRDKCRILTLLASSGFVTSVLKFGEYVLAERRKSDD